MANVPLCLGDEHRALPIDLFSLCHLILVRLYVLSRAWRVLWDLRNALLRGEAALSATERPILGHLLLHHLLLEQEPLIVIVTWPRCNHLLSIHHVEVLVLSTLCMFKSFLSRLEADRLAGARTRLDRLSRES